MAGFMVFLALTCLGGSYILYNVYLLILNYCSARTIGVPTVVLPFSPENPVWLLLGNSIVSIVKRLFGESHFTRFSVRAWIHYEKARPHLELGDFIVIVTPGKNWLFVCNATAMQEILQRRHDFPRPLELLSMLNVFGPNVSTVEGAAWRRQRKVTSTPFNEQNLGLVWTESIRQAEQVLQHWTDRTSPITSTAMDVRTLSLHVLSGAGFGKFYSFQNSAEPPKEGHMFNYKDSLALILDSILLILVVRPKALKQRLLPRRWSRVGQAIVDFQAYMQDMYNEEKQLMADGRQGTVNMMTSLIRAAHDSVAASAGRKKESYTVASAPHLTEAEIYGNTFVYNFAGHDTTAITLGWTMYLLAAHPDVQDWMGEEINRVLGDAGDLAEVYNETFPKFKRCAAVLLEVLRLYNPLTGIIKSTGDTASSIALDDDEHISIPAHTRIVLNTEAIHTHPRYWGADAIQWRPQRWISTSSDAAVSSDEHETLHTPADGTFAPWSDGARVCPGKKFGQVEFVAVMATLFRSQRVEPVPLAGESAGDARARTIRAVNDNAMVLLLQMRRPEDIELRWREVGKGRDGGEQRACDGV